MVWCNVCVWAGVWCDVVRARVFVRVCVCVCVRERERERERENAYVCMGVRRLSSCSSTFINMYHLTVSVPYKRHFYMSPVFPLKHTSD